MDRPRTQFVSTSGVQIAYQVFGRGPDLVVIAGGPSHLELRWHLPASAAFYEELAAFCRVIIFDKRGFGVSERTQGVVPFEEQVADVAAVMESAGSSSAFIYGFLDGGALAALFAVAHPELTRGLVVESCPARVLSAPDYPYGFEAEEWEGIARDVEQWSVEDFLRFVAPQARANDVEGEELIRYAAAGGGPAGLAALMRAVTRVDLRTALPRINVRTHVLGRADDVFTSVEAVRDLANSIVGATFVEVPSVTPSDEPLGLILDELRYFIAGERRAVDVDRVLLTLLFVDVVGSTERVTDLGDARWRKLLDRHDAAIVEVVERFGGRVVKTTGDGALAIFDGPARAVRAAEAIRKELRTIGIVVRAGVHAGEVERRGDDVAGLAVHVAARVQSAATPDEVLVSRTVVDLVAGSGLAFEDRGEHNLKGVAEPTHLFAVIGSAR